MGFKGKPVVVYFDYFDIQFEFRAYSAFFFFFFFFFFLPYSFYGTTKRCFLICQERVTLADVPN